MLEERWLRTMDSILNVEAKLVDANCWYTFPPKDKIVNHDEMINYYDAQIWHRDMDKLRDYKIFIYLTDCKIDDCGPFELIKNTHKITLDIIKYSFPNSLRIFDKNLKKKYHEKKFSVYGKIGDSFVVDTTCFHRGTLVKKNNYRCVLELDFSDTSFGKHFKYNHYFRPKLKKEWDSYELWKKALSEKPERYKHLFLGSNS